MLENKNKSLFFLVGKNGCGKTYALQNFNRKNQNSILIDEDGLPNFSTFKKRIKIDYINEVYIFEDEEKRGIKDVSPETERIQLQLIDGIRFANEMKSKLNVFKKKSKGQEKLYNLLSIFTEYNFNNIEYMCFDEPENYLDEEFIKVVAKFIKILIKNGIIVRVATHNVRLLAEMKVDLSDIILFENFKMKQLLLEDIKRIYKETKDGIEDIRKRDGHDEDSNIRSKLMVDENERFFDVFLSQMLKNESFYRCLFHETIILVEGESEIVAIQNIKTKFETSVEVYSPYGKAHIPFFTKLFLAINKKVIVVIDDDEGSNKHPIVLTKYLSEEKEQLNQTNTRFELILHSPDLEGFYGIDLNTVADEIGMGTNVRKNSGWLKIIASMIFFEQEENRERLNEHLQRQEEISNPFEFE